MNPCSLLIFPSQSLLERLLFSAYVPPVCKMMIPDGHWQAESKNLRTCLHVRFAHGRNGRTEFKIKFGVRNGVHLSTHLRSVMRSGERFSREKHLIIASVLRAPVALRKEAKSLFSRGSEGKLITRHQGETEKYRTWQKYTGGVTVRGWCAHADLCLSSFITTSHIRLSIQL